MSTIPDNSNFKPLSQARVEHQRKLEQEERERAVSNLAEHVVDYVDGFVSHSQQLAQGAPDFVAFEQPLSGLTEFDVSLHQEGGKVEFEGEVYTCNGRSNPREGQVYPEQNYVRGEGCRLAYKTEEDGSKTYTLGNNWSGFEFSLKGQEIDIKKAPNNLPSLPSVDFTAANLPKPNN